MQIRESAPIRLRPIAFALLAVYAAALFLSALPDPVRPDLLRIPSSLTQMLLRNVLIRGGISVFLPPRERITQVLRNDCIFVRGVAHDGTGRWLQPSDGRCITTGLRPAIPDLEWLVRSILTGGEGFQTELMREVTLGDFFCYAPPWRDRFDVVEFLWNNPVFDIDSGAESSDPLILFRWRCHPPALLSEMRKPNEAQVRSFLGSGS